MSLSRPRSAETLPETSFVDRYRGTEYDNSPPPPPAEPVPPAKKRAPTWLLLVAGGALLCVGLAGGAYIAFGSQQRAGGLPGFVNMTQPPAAVVAAPSPSPGPTIFAVATRTPGPSPVAWLADPNNPGGLFISNMTAADASYHVEINMTMTAGGESAWLAESGDVHGSDYSLAITVTTAEKTVDISTIYKSGYLYGNVNNSGWVRQKIDDPGILGNADAYKWADMQYVGRETVQGAPLHHLRVPIEGFVGDPQTLASMGISFATPSYKWDVWVDDAGRPVTGSIDTVLSATIDRLDVQVAMKSDYAFSSFGKPITIRAPKHYRVG